MTDTKPQQQFMVTLAEKNQMTPEVLYATLAENVFKPDKHGQLPTPAQQAMFLATCVHYDLNPLLKEAYPFCDGRGGLQTIVGVDGWAKMAKRAGLDFSKLSLRVVWDTKTPGRLFAYTAKYGDLEITETLSECQRDTDPWKHWPNRMLRHKAFIQLVRLVCGISGLMERDEAERIGHASNGSVAIPSERQPLLSENGPNDHADEGSGRLPALDTRDFAEELPAIAPPETAVQDHSDDARS